METRPWTQGQYDFTTAEGRAEFIEDTPSGIYTGTNEDNERVFIFVDQGDGMIIKTQHTAKPQWLECVEYDCYGWQQGVIYEPFKD